LKRILAREIAYDVVENDGDHVFDKIQERIGHEHGKRDVGITVMKIDRLARYD
jgi:hypothetical protein